MKNVPFLLRHIDRRHLKEMRYGTKLPKKHPANKFGACSANTPTSESHKAYRERGSDHPSQ